MRLSAIFNMGSTSQAEAFTESAGQDFGMVSNRRGRKTRYPCLKVGCSRYLRVPRHSGRNATSNKEFNISIY
jgi:hypothetical protein